MKSYSSLLCENRRGREVDWQASNACLLEEDQKCGPVSKHNRYSFEEMTQGHRVERHNSSL